MAHPLHSSLENLQKEGVRIQEIILKPLELATVNQWLADTLKSSPETTRNLAELIQAKTGGNPFFITEFLQALYTENLLNCDYNQKRWIWDVNQVKKRNFTDNVVALMVAKIEKLPPRSQEALKLAACIGNQFELNTLAVIWETSARETALNLQDAVAESLIQPLGDDYKIILLEPLESVEQENPASPFLRGMGGGSKVEYQFGHDRIQQAAYSLIPNKLKQRVHLQIGQLLLQNTPETQIEEKIFDIVNQLNHGIELVNNQEERDKFANLNLMAGQKAKSSSAYQPALMYLQQGLVWLGIDGWQRQYETVLALNVEAAEAAYLCGQFEEMETLVAAVLENAHGVLDKVKAYEVRILAYTAQEKLRKAVEDGLAILNLLGVKLPPNPSKLDIILGLVKTKLMLAGKKLEDLVELPEMRDAHKKAAMQILNRINTAAYMNTPNLTPLLIFKGVSLSIQYGNHMLSPAMYAGYGTILCGFLGDIESGYRFGELALKVLERFKIRTVEARVVFVVNYFISHWQEHPQQTLKPLLEGYSIGLETLELEDASYCVLAYLYYLYCIGQELAWLEQEMAKYSELFKKFKQKHTDYSINRNWQIIFNLRGMSENKCCLIGEVYNEYEILNFDRNDVTLIFYLYIDKLTLCYWFEQDQEALDNAALVEKYIDAGGGSVAVPIFYFYDSLARLRIYPLSPKPEQKRLYRKVQINQRKMKKWAHYAPMNYLHKFYLVEAERYRILGQIQKALDCYDRAIALAKENQYIQEEALAYELAAKFYLSQDKELIARTYMQEAHYRYLRWGAIAKVKDLETRYPQLLQKSESSFRGSGNSQISVTSTSGSQSSEILDLATVIKSSQAISGEIILDQLLIKLMKILLENTGAQIGYLIFEQGGQFVIEASGTVETESITVLQSLPLETRVPISIINYVARSRESVICNNAIEEGKFNTELYIQRHQSKSILCTPLINQGKLISIVYLENNLTVAAFTPKRIEVVNVLSSQAAISIENAKLYTELRQLNQAFERFVPSEFLQFLNKQSIVDVQLGDQIEQEMSVLFSDIRNFTTISEQMNPEENFRFINSYLSHISPVIREHQGFIDKYIGDAIMALFSGGADNAVKAGIAMLNKLVEYNQYRANSGYQPIAIGIGISTGLLMLGTVGEPNRLDATVISDAVNLASRTEGLTKNYGISFLITDKTFNRLQNPRDYAIRRIDEVKVKGKSEYVTFYEVFDADPPERKAAKLAMLPTFNQALSFYLVKDYAVAAEWFRVCEQICPQDTVVKIYLEWCRRYLGH